MTREFQNRALIVAKRVVFLNFNSLKPANKEMIDLVPGKNLFAKMTIYPYFPNQFSAFSKPLTEMNLIFPARTIFLSNWLPIKKRDMNPRTLPAVVNSNVGTKWSESVAINEPPTITTKSLGEGGKIFSINAKRKSAK